MKHQNKIIVAIIAFALLSFGIRWYVENEVYSPSAHYQKTDQVKRWWAGLWDKKQDVPEIKNSEPPKPEDYQDPIWPPSSTIDWELRAKLPQELLDKIDQSPFPIQVPSSDKYLKNATILGSTFVFNREEDEPLSISIITQPIKDSEKPLRFWTREFRGSQAQLMGGEGSWRLKWFEDNNLYYIHVFCLPSTCQDESFILDLANSLRYVGGKHALGGVE